MALSIAAPVFANDAPPVTAANGENKDGKCPVTGAVTTTKPPVERAYSNADWWPNQLNLRVLHQNPPSGNPMGEDHNYAKEFKKVDLVALKKDIDTLMTTSQD